ncbi:MAG: tetratricopeptide repeat protein [bacterium]
MGQRALARGDWSKAEKYFKHAVSIHPTFSEAVLGLAHARREKGSLKGALKTYRQARALQPNSAAAAEGEGLTLYLMRDFTPAEKALTETLALEPNRPQAAACLGDCLLIRGDLRGALNYWKVALDHGANLPRLKTDYSDLAAYVEKYGVPNEKQSGESGIK